MYKMKLIIIGNGMVGYKFCEKLLSKISPGEISLTVFGEENRPAYDRVHLSEYFSGKTAEELYLAPANWYAENNINLHLGDPVQSIDPIAKSVHSFSGLTVEY